MHLKEKRKISFLCLFLSLFLFSSVSLFLSFFFYCRNSALHTIFSNNILCSIKFNISKKYKSKDAKLPVDSEFLNAKVNVGLEDFGGPRFGLDNHSGQFDEDVWKFSCGRNVLLPLLYFAILYWKQTKANCKFTCNNTFEKALNFVFANWRKLKHKTIGEPISNYLCFIIELKLFVVQVYSILRKIALKLL